jgi:hypothetical protein
MVRKIVMLLNELSRISECRDCDKSFESRLIRGAWLVRCPTCADIAQRRPSVVIERRQLFSQLVLVESLPGAWKRFQASPKDEGCWEIKRKGSQYGAAWSGRVDMFSGDALPPRVGQVALFEEIEALHRLRSESEKVGRYAPNGIRLTYNIEHRLPPQSEKGREIIDRHRYVRLSSPGAIALNPEELPKLIWLSCYSKTTLKGFGRQFEYQLIGSPLWKKEVTGGVRSGRAYTESVLAIVDDDHPLEVKEVFDR